MEYSAVFLTSEQVAAWQAYDLDEYNRYIDRELFDPETGRLTDLPDWMLDGEINGPFDFELNPSQATWGD